MADRYRVLRGLTYTVGRRRVRHEPGDVAQIPAASVPWLLAQGHIAPATSGKNEEAG